MISGLLKKISRTPKSSPKAAEVPSMPSSPSSVLSSVLNNKVEENTLELKKLALYETLNIYILLTKKSYSELNDSLSKLFSDLSRIKVDNDIVNPAFHKLIHHLKNILEEIEQGFELRYLSAIPDVSSYLETFSSQTSSASSSATSSTILPHYYLQSELDGVIDILGPTSARNVHNFAKTKYLYLLDIDIKKLDIDQTQCEWIAAAVRLEFHTDSWNEAEPDILSTLGFKLVSDPQENSSAVDHTEQKVPIEHKSKNQPESATAQVFNFDEGSINAPQLPHIDSDQPSSYNDKEVEFAVCDPVYFYELQEELRSMIISEEDLINQTPDLLKENIIRLLKNDCVFTLLTLPLNNESENFHMQLNNFKEQDNNKTYLFFKDLSNYLNEFRKQAYANPYSCKLIDFSNYVKDYLIKNSDVCLNDICFSNKEAGKSQTQTVIDAIPCDDQAQNEELPVPPQSLIQDYVKVSSSSSNPLLTSSFDDIQNSSTPLIADLPNNY